MCADSQYVPQPLALEQLIIPDMLPDIDGGQIHLIPKSAWSSPLRVDFPMWNNSDPDPNIPETLTLFWNGEEVTTLSWTAPVPSDELTIMVPERFLQEGEHQLHYRVIPFSGISSESDKFTITIDKTAPMLNDIDSRLDFPDEIDRDGVTARYLENNADQLEAEIPLYTQPQVGDTLYWFWDKTIYENNLADSRTLSKDELTSPITVKFEGDMLRKRGDGPRFASYYIEDRSGNRSADSRIMQLNTSVQPAPRVLPFPQVLYASGTGANATLDPLKAISGTRCTIASNADIFPDEEVWLVWGNEGETGYQRIPVADQQQADIPMALVAACIGKKIPVYYQVIDNEKTYDSDILNLTISLIPVERLTTPQCPLVKGGQLKLSEVPAGGAVITLAPWVMMTTDQRITLVATSNLNDSKDILLDRHQITMEELNSGIGQNGSVTISKAFLKSLVPNKSFDVEAFVSFDDGQSWPVVTNFPRLTPLLVE